MIFSHKRVKSLFKLKNTSKCVPFRPCTALMNVRVFTLTNSQAFTAFGQSFSVTVYILCNLHLFESIMQTLCTLKWDLSLLVKYLIQITIYNHYICPYC